MPMVNLDLGHPYTWSALSTLLSNSFKTLTHDGVLLEDCEYLLMIHSSSSPILLIWLWEVVGTR